MARPAPTIDERTTARETRAIDDVIGTLYVLDLRGYRLDASSLKSEALKRIHKNLVGLDAKKRKTVEDSAHYRLDRFEKFSHLDERTRGEILRIAREREISLEDAYATMSERA